MSLLSHVFLPSNSSHSLIDQASLGLIYCEVVALYRLGLDSLDPQDIHTNQDDR